MAAFFSRVGQNGRQFYRMSACLRAWRVSRSATLETFAEPFSRSFITDTVARQSSHASSRFYGGLKCKGVVYGNIRVSVQGARFLSLWPWSSSTSNSDLAQEKSPAPELIKNEPQTPEVTNDSVANPFLHENPSNSLLDSELLNDMADTVSSLGEPSLASLGLGGYSPTGLIQQALELIHVQGNLSWCLSIAFFTVIVRVVCLPLIIKAQANTAKMNNIRPQLEESQAKLRELANSHDSVAKATASMKLSQLYKDNDCHPLKSILAPLVQIPLFVSFFFGLKTMANLPVESLKTGGYLWFQDLTLGSEMGVSNPTMKTMKTVMRIVAVATIPITAQFPAAIFAYWITSNLFTVGQVAILSHPAARKAMGIPEMVPYESANSGSFWENLKAGYTNSQEAAYIRHAEKMKQQRQKALGEAPLEPTYELNPRIKENMEMFESLQDKSAQTAQSYSDPGASGRQVGNGADFKSRRVRFNQEIFSGTMSRQAKKEKQKERDRLRNRPGATM
ncbi:Mitochondrial inner membrane protein OXA1L [Acropora cervicornis]|uniref:Mitochondrial inner membrane protein OXA1L n=1 Tax=Acropora cervicornis TaxID=6130 RepID=A0AAD9Q507_ACRCE|nr:Mitochondrial inner membrane protein OXA1L [Acropora cervicornis]